MQDKVVIVTGANAGLGFELCLKLARLGAHVVMACRSVERGERAREQVLASVPGARVTMLPLDVSEIQSIRDFGVLFRERLGKVDVLVNNAGIAYVPLSRNSSGYESQFATNYLGPFALVGTLLPMFRDRTGARIVNVGSLAHRLGKLDLDKLNAAACDYSKFGAYARGKLALLAYTVELDRRLRERGSHIIALAAHPGFAATDIAKHTYQKGLLAAVVSWFAGLLKRVIPASEGAEPILHSVLGEGVEGGSYFGPSGFMEISGGPPTKARVHPRAFDAALAQRLWTVSERLSRTSYLSS